MASLHHWTTLSRLKKEDGGGTLISYLYQWRIQHLREGGNFFKVVCVCVLGSTIWRGGVWQNLCRQVTSFLVGVLFYIKHKTLKNID